MGEEIELHLPRDAQYVGLARLVVMTAARQAGVDPARLEDLRLAVSEATTNAMMATADDGASEPVVLLFGRRDEHAFGVTISGVGPGFSVPPAVSSAEPDWPDEGGLGVTLIRGLADEIDFGEGEPSHVSMRFEVGAAAGSDTAGEPGGADPNPVEGGEGETEGG